MSYTDIEGTLASATARSITLDLKAVMYQAVPRQILCTQIDRYRMLLVVVEAISGMNKRPCDDRAPLRHMMEERRREKLRQHLTQAIVAPYFALAWLIDERQVSCMLQKHTSHSS